MEYQLKVIVNNVRVTKLWEGATGQDACRRYQDAHRDELVIAWRDKPHGLFILGDPRQIVD